MRVRMLTTVAEHRENEPIRVLEVGEEYDVPADEGKELCSEPADFPRAEPVAVKKAEVAEKPKPRRRAKAETRARA